MEWKEESSRNVNTSLETGQEENECAITRLLLLKFISSKGAPVTLLELITYFQSNSHPLSSNQIDEQLNHLLKDSKLRTATYDFDGERLTVYWIPVYVNKEKITTEEDNQHRQTLSNDVEQLQQQLKDLEKEINAKRNVHKKLHSAHLERLHRYNDMKDCGQMLLGQLATLDSVRTKDLYAQFGLNLDD